MNTDWHEIIQRYIAGTTTAEEAATLQEALKNDAGLRTLYLDYMNLDVALEAKAEAAEMTPAADRVIVPQVTRWSRWNAWRPLAAAAGVMIAALLGLKWNSSIRSEAPWVKLAATTNARWEDTTTELSLNSGDEPSGMLRLADGKAEFSTRNGAVVVIEAPAAIRFEAPASAYVETGKVVCRCPTPASRLTVRTAQTRVVDLGTEFAVEARADSSTRVAVFSGEVKVGGDASPTVLHTGQAAEVRTLGVMMLETAVAQKMTARLDDGASAAGTMNRLRNPGFDSSQLGGWEFTENHASIEGAAVRVSSRESRFWPSVRQRIWQADLSGRAVMASVRAMQPEDDPLQPMQFAVLKLVFMGKRGVQFAYASRHFQFGGEKAGIFQNAQVAAIAPPGTKGVSIELLLNARGEKHGSVIFDDAVLAIGEPHPIPSPSK